MRKRHSNEINANSQQAGQDSVQARVDIASIIKNGNLAGFLDAMRNNKDAVFAWRSSKGNSLLHLAVYYGQVDIALALIAAGVDVTVKNQQGETAEQVTGEHRNAHFFSNEPNNVLQEQKNKFAKLIGDGNIDKVQKWLQKNPNWAQVSLTSSQQTAMHLAVIGATQNHKEIAKLLLQAGANLTAVDGKGQRADQIKMPDALPWEQPKRNIVQELQDELYLHLRQSTSYNNQHLAEHFKNPSLLQIPLASGDSMLTAMLRRDHVQSFRYVLAELLQHTNQSQAEILQRDYSGRSLVEHAITAGASQILQYLFAQHVYQPHVDQSGNIVIPGLDLFALALQQPKAKKEIIDVLLHAQIPLRKDNASNLWPWEIQTVDGSKNPLNVKRIDLINALLSGDLPTINRYWQTEPQWFKQDVNIVNDLTVLQFAAKFNQPKILDYLLKRMFAAWQLRAAQGADSTHWLSDLLYIAVQHNSKEVVQYLLQQGANPNAIFDKNDPFNAGHTLLHVAAYYHEHEIIDLLLPHINEQTMQSATSAINPPPQAVQHQQMTQAQATPSYLSYQQPTSNKNENILQRKVNEFIEAILDGTVDVVKQFVQQNIYWLSLPLNEQKQTAWHIAAQFNKIELLQFMAQLSKKQDVNAVQAVDDFGFSPQDYLVHYNHSWETITGLSLPSDNDLDTRAANYLNKLVMALVDFVSKNKPLIELPGISEHLLKHDVMPQAQSALQSQIAPCAGWLKLIQREPQLIDLLVLKQNADGTTSYDLTYLNNLIDQAINTKPTNSLPVIKSKMQAMALLIASTSTEKVIEHHIGLMQWLKTEQEREENIFSKVAMNISEDYKNKMYAGYQDLGKFFEKYLTDPSHADVLQHGRVVATQLLMTPVYAKSSNKQDKHEAKTVVQENKKESSYTDVVKKHKAALDEAQGITGTYAKDLDMEFDSYEMAAQHFENRFKKAENIDDKYAISKILVNIYFQAGMEDGKCQDILDKFIEALNNVHNRVDRSLSSPQTEKMKKDVLALKAIIAKETQIIDLCEKITNKASVEYIEAHWQLAEIYIGRGCEEKSKQALLQVISQAQLYLQQHPHNTKVKSLKEDAESLKQRLFYQTLQESFSNNEQERIQEHLNGIEEDIKRAQQPQFVIDCLARVTDVIVRIDAMINSAASNQELTTLQQQAQSLQLKLEEKIIAEMNKIFERAQDYNKQGNFEQYQKERDSLQEYMKMCDMVGNAAVEKIIKAHESSLACYNQQMLTVVEPIVLEAGIVKNSLTSLDNKVKNNAQHAQLEGTTRLASIIKRFEKWHYLNRWITENIKSTAQIHAGWDMGWSENKQYANDIYRTLKQEVIRELQAAAQRGKQYFAQGDFEKLSKEDCSFMHATTVAHLLHDPDHNLFGRDEEVNAAVQTTREIFKDLNEQASNALKQFKETPEYAAQCDIGKKLRYVQAEIRRTYGAYSVGCLQLISTVIEEINKNIETYPNNTKMPAYLQQAQNVHAELKQSVIKELNIFAREAQRYMDQGKSKKMMKEINDFRRYTQKLPDDSDINETYCKVNEQVNNLLTKTTQPLEQQTHRHVKYINENNESATDSKVSKVTNSVDGMQTSKDKLEVEKRSSDTTAVVGDGWQAPFARIAAPNTGSREHKPLVATVRNGNGS